VKFGALDVAKQKTFYFSFFWWSMAIIDLK